MYFTGFDPTLGWFTDVVYGIVRRLVAPRPSFSQIVSHDRRGVSLLL